MPDELVFHTNKAAVFLEMKQYEECIRVCDHCILITKDKVDYEKPKLAKAYSRKGTALLKMGKIEDSIATFEKGLEVSPEEYLKKGLFEAKKTKEELFDYARSNLNSGKVWKPSEE